MIKKLHVSYTLILTFIVLAPGLYSTFFGLERAWAATTESYSLIRQWGSFGTDNGQFHLPWSLALDSSNNVFVVDRNNERIQKFDHMGDFIKTWSPGRFQQPVGIAIDSLDNVYVTVIDNGFNVVNKYTTDGSLVKSWVVGDRDLSNIDTQNAIATDSSNNVYVSSNNHIFKYTTDGQLIKSWGSKGSGNGEFNQIVGIATDSTDNVYVTDKYNLRVEKFTSDGGFVKSWGADCQAAKVFCSEPQGIATDLSNNVYVTEYNAGRVSKFTSDGDFITGWDVPSAYGIDVDHIGDVYISSGTDAILVYAPTSHNTPPNTAITSAVDGNGNPVQDGGSTASTSITFHVTATSGSSPVVGFQCSLDGEPFSTCASTNPATINYDNLESGQEHTFEVQAVDTEGTKDPTPDTFSWTILTPKQAIQNLINTIDGMHLSKGTTTSLEAPLNAAVRQSSRNNDISSCSLLNAFLHQVDAKENNGQLTPKQAADLRQQALTLAITMEDALMSLRSVPVTVIIPL